jgi:hypothetical protein
MHSRPRWLAADSNREPGRLMRSRSLTTTTATTLTSDRCENSATTLGLRNANNLQLLGARSSAAGPTCSTGPESRALLTGGPTSGANPKRCAGGQSGRHAGGSVYLCFRLAPLMGHDRRAQWRRQQWRRPAMNTIEIGRCSSPGRPCESGPLVRLSSRVSGAAAAVIVQASRVCAVCGATVRSAVSSERGQDDAVAESGGGPVRCGPAGGALNVNTARLPATVAGIWLCACPSVRLCDH